MSKKLKALLVGFGLAISAVTVQAQVVPVSPTPQVGSSNPVTAEPLVPRPETQPCTVALFENVAFENFIPLIYSYQPPAGCPGPWSKVVFNADFTVTAGRQFDRTASFYLGHANIYYGTTAEPRSKLSPSWHVERDVTDLTAIFRDPQTGQADLGNFVGVSGGVNYNGIIYVTAALQFYPTRAFEPAPRTPDIVVPVNGPGGDAGTLNTSADQITQTLNLPRNVERVYLDVIAQSQIGDEFWYLCVPNDQASSLQSCGNTGFRETEISLDGKPAGVAPVSPWIYTGGIDPYLWEPITGVQTLEFKPYRVDLTPFAGVLSDGGAHTVAISVFNANGYFLATANLLVYTDPWSNGVHGGVTENTLAGPTPVITEEITAQPGPIYSGTVDVTSDRDFRIRGYIVTSHGRIETTLDESVRFSNHQTFYVSSPKYVQDLVQLSTVETHTRTRAGEAELVNDQTFSFPLTLDYSFLTNPDGSASQTVSVDQKQAASHTRGFGDEELFRKTESERVISTDTLNISASGSLSGPPSGSSTAAYRSRDSLGHCYRETLKSADQKLTSVAKNDDCPQ